MHATHLTKVAVDGHAADAHLQSRGREKKENVQRGERLPAC